MMKICGEAWRKMPEEIQQKYKDISAVDKIRYEREKALETLENGGVKLNCKRKTQPNPFSEDFLNNVS